MASERNRDRILFTVITPYDSFPKPQLGYVHTSHFRHRPPHPRRTISCFVISTPADNTGQQDVKHRRFGVHHTSGQPEDRHTVLEIAHQHHGHRGSTGARRRSRCALRFAGNRCGGHIVRIHAHAACAEDQVDPGGAQSPELRSVCFPARPSVMVWAYRFNAVGGELCPHHGREPILDQALEYLAASGHNARFQRP